MHSVFLSFVPVSSNSYDAKSIKNRTEKEQQAIAAEQCCYPQRTAQGKLSAETEDAHLELVLFHFHFVTSDAKNSFWSLATEHDSPSSVWYPKTSTSSTHWFPHCINNPKRALFFSFLFFFFLTFETRSVALSWNIKKSKLIPYDQQSQIKLNKFLKSKYVFSTNACDVTARSTKTNAARTRGKTEPRHSATGVQRQILTFPFLKGAPALTDGWPFKSRLFHAATQRVNDTLG